MKSKKNKLFKWIDEKDYQNDPILWALTEEMVQGQAEDEINRKLTQVELHRLRYTFSEHDDMFWKYLDFVSGAIDCAIDNKGNQWEVYDKWFKEKKSKK